VAAAGDPSALFADRCSSHACGRCSSCRKRCGRAPDWQSGALTCARCANEILSKRGERTSCQGIRTTVHQPRLSKVTHLIYGVAGSDLVVELDVMMWHRCLSPCSHPSAFWLLCSRSLRSRSCRSSSAPLHTRTRAGRMPWMGQPILLSGLERNCGLMVCLKMEKTPTR